MKQAGLLLLAWLLGIVTALAWPSLQYQRMTVVTGGAAYRIALVQDGWILERVDEGYFTFSRPRIRLP